MLAHIVSFDTTDDKTEPLIICEALWISVVCSSILKNSTGIQTCWGRLELTEMFSRGLVYLETDSRPAQVGQRVQNVYFQQHDQSIWRTD